MEAELEKQNTQGQKFTFKSLEVWKEGHALVLEVYKMTKKFPKDEVYGLSSQMRRCAVSITSNIAEGFGRGSFKEKHQFYSISRGSITELQNQLLIAKDVGYISEAELNSMEEKTEKTFYLLAGLMKKTSSHFSNFSFVFFFILFSFILFSFPFISSAAGLVRAPNNLGLAGYWSFDEGVGTYVGDHSGHGNGATYNGDPEWVPGKRKTAMSFDGSGDNVNLGNKQAHQITGSQTISMWLKPGVLNARRNPYAKAYGGEGTITQEINGTLNYYYGTAGGNTAPYQGFGSSAAVTVGEWTHMVIVRDLDAMTLTWYKDGVAVASGSANYAAAGVSSLSTTIGTGYAGQYLGEIDEVRLYSRALSASEVRNLYSSGAVKLGLSSNSRVTDGLVGHWTFDGKDISGSTVSDISGNANNLTIVGNVTPALGKFGQSLEYPDSTSYVTATDEYKNISNLTVSFWYWNSGVVPNSRHFVLGNSNLHATGHEGFKFIAGFSNPNRLEFRVERSGLLRISIATNVPVGEWVHVVGRSTSSAVQIYINGQLAGTTSGITDSGSGSSFRIGRNTGGEIIPPGSRIDDVRIYDRSITDDELAVLHKMGVGTTQGSISTVKAHDGLVGYWSFDGQDVSATTVTDKSGQGNDITRMNSPQPAIGKVGQGMKVEGGGYLRILTASGLNFAPGSFTFSVWIKSPLSGSGWRTIAEYNRGGANWFGVWLSSTHNFHFRVGGTTRNSVAVLQADEWYQLTGVYESSTKVMSLYVNGQFDSQITQASGYTGAANSKLTIGTRGLEDTEFFNGIIDEMRIYNKALSADEVRQLYLMGK